MDVFVARQPILDRQGNLYGYELLFRSNAEALAFRRETNASEATTTVLSNSLIAIGFDRLVGKKTAFVNFDRELLLAKWRPPLAPGMVIEVLETVEPDDEVVEACRNLRTLGFQIALDDFVSRPGYERLIAVADIVKLEIGTVPRARARAIVNKFHAQGLRVLAEKVETHVERDWAHRAGFDYFQGYFFAKPELVRARQIPAETHQCMRLVRETQRPDIDFDKLERVIRENIGFTYQLLRFVNSAAFGRSERVESIRTALQMLGEDNVRRWVPLVAVNQLAGDKPKELVVQSLVRARFCELMERSTGGNAGSNAFLMGLFSLLDALLDRPLDKALEEVALPDQVSSALLCDDGEGEGQTDPGSLTSLRRAMQSYETADWSELEVALGRLGVAPNETGTAYEQAVAWADAVLRE